jgi:hypothetical protein
MENEIQFDQVERPAGASACASCRGALVGSYFQANGQILCANCAEKIRGYFQSNEGAPGRVLKATVFGIGGGLAGGVVYAGVLALAHINAALITILIGWLVGKAVRKGSGSRGGIGYQILAVAITYLSIGLSATAAAFFSGEVQDLSLFAAILVCIIGSFTAPIYNATHSLLGGIIVLFGLMQAWKLNTPAQVNITGPHALAPVVPTSAVPAETPESTPLPMLPPPVPLSPPSA